MAFVLVALGIGGCYGNSDPLCNDPPPVATQLAVGLFDQTGAPLCDAPTLLIGSQPRLDLETDEFDLVGLVLLDDEGHLREVPGEPCNEWATLPAVGPDRRFWQSCSGSIVVRVEVPGCTPAEVEWTWEDNTYPGRNSLNWMVPVQLTCAR